MGDAGPPTPLLEEREEQATVPSSENVRDIHVLVTGFGAFKSFSNNPSWLIASGLPKELSRLPSDGSEDALLSEQNQTQPTKGHDPPTSLHFMRPVSQPQQGQPDSQQPLRECNIQPYRIYIHTYPFPVRVAYAPTSVLIPSLLNPATNSPTFPAHPSGLSFDYIVHIGLASGRDSYTLETVAHRDDYVIPDVDDADGYLPGTRIWTQLGIPDSLLTGWHPQDVLRRWEIDVNERWREHEARELQRQLVAQAQAQQEQEPAPPSGLKSWIASHGMLLHASKPTSSASIPAVSPPRKPVVKLSRDAGRYLCEFILMCSLVYRWQEAREHQPYSDPKERQQAIEKVGKVAFLHVPNGTLPQDVTKGVLVAESAIRSLVASWEAGWRNPAVYAAGVTVNVGVQAEADIVKEGGVETSAGFESRGTGDAVP